MANRRPEDIYNDSLKKQAKAHSVIEKRHRQRIKNMPAVLALPPTVSGEQGATHTVHIIERVGRTLSNKKFLAGMAGALLLGAAGTYMGTKLMKADPPNSCAPFKKGITQGVTTLKKEPIVPVDSGISLPAADTSKTEPISKIFSFNLHTNPTVQAVGRSCFLAINVDVIVSDSYDQSSLTTLSDMPKKAADFKLPDFANFIYNDLSDPKMCPRILRHIENAVSANAQMFQDEYFPATYLSGTSNQLLRSDYYPFSNTALPDGPYRLVVFGGGNGAVLTCPDPNAVTPSTGAPGNA